MYSEGRLTRSRARTLAAEGQGTPLVQIPEGKTPRTRTRTARKATEAPTPRAALFDVTNAETQEQELDLPPVDETGAVDFQAEPTQEVGPVSEAKAVDQEDVADLAKECTTAIFTSIEQATLEVCADHVLEESTEMQPLSGAQPIASIKGTAEPASNEVHREMSLSQDADAPELQGSLYQEESVEVVAFEAAEEPPTTPATAISAAPNAAAPTPTGLGLSSFAPLSPLGTTIMVSTNTPTVTPLHGVPVDAMVYGTLNAAVKAFAQQEEHDAGFGSPVRADSPAMSVSIGGHISTMDYDDEVEDGEVRSKSPAGASIGALSPAAGPALADHNSPAFKSPARMSPLAPNDLAASPAGSMLQASAEKAGASVKKFSPLAAPRDAVPRAAVRSKVVVASPFDPRSLRQLKKEIKQKFAAKEAASAANSEDDEAEEVVELSEQDINEELGSDEEDYAEASDELLAAMEALQLNSPELNPYRLYGMPKPQGKHIRFDDDGDQYVSPRLKTLLRGMPTPHGKHMFFDDDDE